MNKEISNSISIVGNISSIGEDKLTPRGKIYKFFDICKSSEYLNEEGEEVKSKEFFTVKIYEATLSTCRDLIKIGKWVHIVGYVRSYIDDKGIRRTYIVSLNVRDLSNPAKEEKLFDYDWLNDTEKDKKNT